MRLREFRLPVFRSLRETEESFPPASRPYAWNWDPGPENVG